MTSRIALVLDLLLWLTHLNATLLLIGSLAVSQVALLLLPAILHSTSMGNKATHLKLDAWIREVEGVENRLMGAERLEE